MRHPRRPKRPQAWRATVLTGALALSLGIPMTTPATGATPASQLAVDNGVSGALSLSAGYLSIGLDGTGTVTGLLDSRTGLDYLAPGKAASLVSLVIDGRQIRPTRVVRDGDGGVLTFSNSEAGYEVDVRAVDKGTYTTLEAVRVHAPDGADVQTLLWGPLATDITRTVGETVGIVRDDSFAIGLRPLTDRTEGAWPQEYQDYGWESEVADNPSRLEVAPHEEWSAAGRTPWGSVLRAFTYDYTKERERQNLNGYRIPVGPLPDHSARVTGSKVALFGTTPGMAPTVLSAVASGEGLPYPTQNGQWQKAAQASSQSFLVLGDLRTDRIPAAARFAKAAGIGYIYSLPNAVGPWQSTGHYQFDSSLGGSDAGAKAAVDLAASNGVRLGVHTISDFISTNDPYVSPAPADSRLALGGRAKLTRPLGAGDTTLFLDSGTLFAGGLGYGKILRIGDEFVSYDTAQKTGDEWQVTGVKRAQWRSVAAAQATGKTAARVFVNQYGGPVGGPGIIKEISTRLATAWNDTGIRSNSYDGVESASESGWGSYGQALLINGAYEQNKAKDGFITETSRMTSNTWDALTRASWGEIASTSMNQVFINNEFYKNNYLPGMLGWISLSGQEGLLSIESKLARGAGLNAGVGFQGSVANLTAGGDNGLKVLDAIKQWETARNLGAFTEAQKARLRDQSTNWHLSVVTPGQAWSLQQLDSAGKPIGEPQVVKTPTPGFTTPEPPDAHVGKLYEFKVASSTPQTIRYEVTSGALPAGLTLNKDTGGITGIPTAKGAGKFTITARNGGGVADASISYDMKVTPPLAPPQITLTTGVESSTLSRGGSVDVSVTVRNDSPQSASGVVSLAGPESVSVEPGSAEFSGLASGETVTRSFRISAKPDSPLGEAVLTASARVTGVPVAPVQVPLKIVNPVDITVAPASLDAGRPNLVPVKVDSNMTGTATVQADVPSGWTADKQSVTLVEGESKIVKLPVTPAVNALGKATVTVSATAQSVTTRATQTFEVLLPNVAVGKPATQQSVAWDGVPSRAVDGNTDGAYGAGSVTHTAEPSNQAWWQVDLEANYAIDQIEIWNRTDCCAGRLSNYWVLVSESPITGDSLEAARTAPGVTALHQPGQVDRPTRIDLTGLRGRYVRVQLESGSNPLSLAEVQVRAKPDGGA
ncbi:discoidin domain-containing protein [Streptomyces sp. NBC_00842]|uniref:galactose-binding domain-containing protein n=1 Tax=Streptomyces sp. NBC_00842 TaxID=2975848 RepID=UPI003867AD05|nr:discoidin domain-containing protein [Streptomyces sp. NBC_00842]